MLSQKQKSNQSEEDLKTDYTSCLLNTSRFWLPL